MGLVAHAFQNNLSEYHNFSSSAEVVQPDIPAPFTEEPEVHEQNPAAKKIVDRMKKFWDNL
jgi:hypothetical protein